MSDPNEDFKKQLQEFQAEHPELFAAIAELLEHWTGTLEEFTEKLREIAKESQ